MLPINIKAHAKINLTLRVLGKRPDGYHELETVMQSLALHDTITLTSQPRGIQLTVAGDAPVGPDNLVHQAALLLQAASGCGRGAAITLTKRIPLAAGLAGGSADAAATLLGLNKLWNLGLPLNQLLALAAKLGSDVPFCLQGGTMLAQGRGEVLTPLAAAPALGVVLIKPNFGVSTAAVYGGFAAVKPTRRPNTKAMAQALLKQDARAVAAELANDLEYVTLAKFPQLVQIKQHLLQAGAQGVLMSGSGPTIFGLTAPGHSALVAAKVDPALGQVIASSIN